jgi:hypothetical protein
MQLPEKKGLVSGPEIVSRTAVKLPDEALLLLVRQWVAKAEVNYRTAERLVRDDGAKNWPLRLPTRFL